jgi:hypothetical protein
MRKSRKRTHRKRFNQTLIKALNIFTILIMCMVSIIPAHSAHANSQEITTLDDTPVSFPEIFSPYTYSDGSYIFDPGADENPIDVDITSGVDRGVGDLASTYVASDGTNFFVRLRLKGDPSDRKGGFLSSVWLVKVAAGGEHKATIGLNGKSPHYDYVYVADASGKNVQPIYVTEVQGGSTVPGTNVTAAENGHYFLDFQVPINRVTAIAGITVETPVQFFFGTSKAANLSVINKEWMNTTSSNGNSTSFSGLEAITLDSQPPTVSIDGGASKKYDTTNRTLTGKSTIVSGEATIVINRGSPITATITSNQWSYSLPDSIINNNDIYRAVVSVTDGGKTATAKQDIMISHNTDSLTIDGGAVKVTNSTTPLLSGTYAGSNANNVRIYVYIDDLLISPSNGSPRDSGALTWSQEAILSNPVDGKIYNVKVEWTNTNGNTLFATTYQQLTYREGVTVIPVTVSIDSITDAGSANPTISGTSSGAEQIEVRVNDSTVEILTPNVDTGAWTVPALERPLAVGDHTITAIASNSSGNTATHSQNHTVSLSSITIDNGASVTINENTPTIRGNTNAVDGSEVTVTIAGVGTYPTTAQNGRWKIEVPINSPITPDGTYTVTASVNSVSAAQQLTIDTTTTVEITGPANNSTTSAIRPAISGQAEEYATIDLVVKKSIGGAIVFVQSLAANGDGEWQYTPTSDLEDEVTYIIEATASDLYGNEAFATSQFTVSSIPQAPVAQTDQPIVTDPSPVRDGDTTLSGTSEPNALVKLTNGATVETVTADVYGNWSFSNLVLAEGDQLSVTATAPDKTESNAATLTVLGVGQQQVSLQSVSAVTRTVAFGSSLSEAKTALGTTVRVTLTDSTTAEVPITWSLDSTPSYDGNVSTNYVFSGTFGALPNGVDNSNNISAPTGTVTVLGQPTINIASAPPVTKTLPLGTSLAEARTALGAAVTVNLEGGGTAQVPVTWNANSTPAFDGSVSQTYSFIGSFGTLPNGVSNGNNVVPSGVITVNDNLQVIGSTDGERTVSITGAIPGAIVTLYDKDGIVIATATVNSEGGVLFTNISPETGYYVRQAIHGVTTGPSSAVNVLPKIAVRFSPGDIWESITLPVFLITDTLDSPITWTSNNEEVMSISTTSQIYAGQIFPEYEATVSRQSEDVNVILTATITKNGQQFNRTFLLVVKGTDFEQQKNTVSSNNAVTMDNNPLSTGIDVTRTTLTNADDNSITQLVDKLVVRGDAFATTQNDVEISFSDRPQGSTVRADEITFEVIDEALQKINNSIKVTTPEATISISSTSLASIKSTGIDLFFRIVPLRTDERKQEVIQRTSQSMQDAAGSNNTVQVLDIPREIVTNYTGFDTEVTLPLGNINIAADQLNTLRVMIEHSDGTRRVVVPGADGEIVYEAGQAVGLKFTISKFSTFTFFQVLANSQAPSVPVVVVPSKPILEIINPVDGEVLSSGANISVIGKTEANKTAELYLNDNLLGTITGDSLGDWSYEIEDELAEGEYTLYISVEENGDETTSNVIHFTVKKEKEELLVHYRYILGYPDGKFMPGDGVTRAQVAAMLARILDMQASHTDPIPNPDVKNHWAQEAIQLMYERNVMQGYTNGKFEPDQAISRGEMAAVIFRFKELVTEEYSSYTFPDIAKHWAGNYIEKLKELKIINGYVDGKFNPNQALTRAEAVVIINRAVNRGGLYGDFSPLWPDVSPDHWAYHDIEEASRSHEAIRREDGQEEFIRFIEEKK